MKKRWIFALTASAVVAIAGAVIMSHRRRDERVDCYPEVCGYCGDEDVMKRECGYAMDMPTLLRNRGRV